MHNKFSIQDQGYNKHEVAEFVDEVIKVIDELNHEHKTTLTENQLLKEQLNRFDEIKEQIKETLQTAQDVATDIKTQALLEQTSILNNAHQEARRVVTEKISQATQLDTEISMYKAKLRSIINSQLEMLDILEK